MPEEKDSRTSEVEVPPVEDQLIQNQLKRYHKAFHVGQMITSEMDKDRLFEVIINQANEAMETERSTVFLYDEENDELWSLVAVGMKKQEIRIPADYGVAGWVFQHRSPVVANDAYKDPRFYAKVDETSGFRTKNILCIPLINWNRTCIGALQSLNKISGDFTEEDKALLFAISNFVTIALENMKVYEELKSLDKARERTLNHLSHELKTPVAMVKAVLDRVIKEGDETGNEKLVKRVLRGQRNVNRLIDLQEKINDIWVQKPYEEKERMTAILQNVADFVEACQEESPQNCAQAMALIVEHIESVYSTEESITETVVIHDLLNEICHEALSSAQHRNLEIKRNVSEGLFVDADRRVLKKVFGGLLKNAIENTPDEGKIEVRVRGEGKEICVDFNDYGVGISPQNQKLISGGFFHTQDTMFYSSKRPYDFNAGGSGADLLRAKSFSERHGFSIGFKSTRCRFIPDDTDECPGRISACRFIKKPSECLESGGSSFFVKLPVENV